MPFFDMFNVYNIYMIIKKETRDVRCEQLHEFA